MDTILYFYKKRGLKEPEIEPVGMKTYLLIRVALDVGSEEWFGWKLRQDPPGSPSADINAVQDAADASKESTASKMGGGLLLRIVRHPLQALRRFKRSRVEPRREGMEYFPEVESAVRKLASAVQEMAEDIHDCFCVYEDSVRRDLVGEAQVSQDDFWEPAERQENRRPGLAFIWQKSFPWEEFDGYFRQFWVEQLLPEAIWPHFVILGTAPCLFPLLERTARRMKSLRWVILEADCDSEFLEFVEDFYTEYGLAIALQTLESSAAWKRLRLACGEPVNILDFTGETYMALQEVAKGSIWLDLCSVEEKRRRIVMRGDSITYISLKEKWRRAQKRCNCPIFP